LRRRKQIRGAASACIVRAGKIEFGNRGHEIPQGAKIGQVTKMEPAPRAQSTMTDDALPIPVHAILGPSGSGKSTIGAAMARDAGTMHVELDRFPYNGFRAASLHGEWESFTRGGDPAPLAGECRRRAQQAGKQRIVLTATSRSIAPPATFASARQAGLFVHVLFGPRYAFLRAFLERERDTGRGLNESWWLSNNRTYREFRKAGYAPFRLDVIENGERIGEGEIVRRILARETS
jgi:hypothetical protein